MSRPPLGLLAVLTLLALGTAITSVADSPTAATAPEQVEVVGATAVCPDLIQLDGVVASRVSVGAAPLPAGRDATGGSVTSRVLTLDQDVRVPLTRPGQVAVGLGTTIDRNALAVSATGALAVGLEVEQVTRGERYSTRGLAGIRCVPPRSDSWFVGAGTGINDSSYLILANVDDGPATVDVTVTGSHSDVDPRPGRGISVGPHGRLVLAMDALAPDQQFFGVRVQARRGRVAAAIRHQSALGRVAKGFDWLPLQDGPVTDSVVPGFPQGPGRRLLIIANPGIDDATAEVQVTTRDGQFVPTGMDALTVAAGRVRVVTLDRLTDASPLAVRVRSDVPVISGGRVDDYQLPPIQDLSYTGGTEPLTGAALLTDLVIDRPTESTLILTAPDTSGSVVVTPIQVIGQAGALPAPRSIRVPGGRTVAFKLSTFFPPGTVARLAVEVRPELGSGPIYAARYLRARGAHGPLTTLLDLQGPAQRVQRPRVVADPAAARP
jgi:hypothetical protein